MFVSDVCLWIWCAHLYLMYVCMYVCRFQNIVLRCLTPRLHCFLSSNRPSFRFLLFMAFLIPSIQFFFGLPRALFCFGIHFNVILGNLPSAILWTWPYHVSWFCSFSFTIGSSNPILYLLYTFVFGVHVCILSAYLYMVCMFLSGVHICIWCCPVYSVPPYCSPKLVPTV